jgi:hypothetical protein
MAVRKYKGWRNPESDPGARIIPTGSRPSTSDEPVTAYDERDVLPLVEAVRFEVGCMRHYAEEKGGLLGKLADEMATPLEAALAAFDTTQPQDDD